MRKNLSDSSKVTVDNFVYTDWFEIESGNLFVEKLLADLNFKQLNFTNFYQLYKDINDKLNLYNISKVKGKIISNENSNMSTSDMKECYDKIQLLNIQIMKLKSQLKKADSIKDKVELNMELNKLKQEKAQLLEEM